MTNENTETTGAVERAAEAILEACYGQDLPEAPVDLARAALVAAYPLIARRVVEHEGDGYHTHAELYRYRMLYNAHAAKGWLAAGVPVVKSWRHSDGVECFGGGWFIVTATLPSGQVSNHYEAADWDLFHVPEVDRAPEWDGHTPADAADRLAADLVPEGPGVRWPCPKCGAEAPNPRCLVDCPTGHVLQVLTDTPKEN